ncbi:hypothetical protein FOZ62_010939, partial [Perkinsus olseni]
TIFSPATSLGVNLAPSALLPGPTVRQTEPPLLCIVDSEDFLSALNFSARDQRKSLPLILDFGILDALANLSGSAAVDLVERYVNGVLTAVRPRAGDNANQGGQWLLVSRQSPSMIASVVNPFGGVVQSAFSVPSVDKWRETSSPSNLLVSLIDTTLALVRKSLGNEGPPQSERKCAHG